MAFIVTGGAGFIGSHLVEDLLKKGEKVTVIDNLHTGSLNNIKGMDAEFVKGRSKEILSINKRVDGIYHLGIYSSSPMYKENRFLLGEAIEDFIAVMEFAKKHGTKVVLTSSSSIYNGSPTPWKEDADLAPSDFYTEGRIAMERIAAVYDKMYGTKCSIIRPFSVYGPREESKGKYANLVSQFLWDMKNDKSPVIYGDGTQARDFIWVEDIVKAFTLAMEKETIGAFNAGTGKSHSLNHVIKIKNKLLGKDIKPTYVPNDIKNYVKETLAHTEKSEKTLGFKAKVDLEEGIKRLVKRSN